MKCASIFTFTERPKMALTIIKPNAEQNLRIVKVILVPSEFVKLSFEVCKTFTIHQKFTNLTIIPITTLKRTPAW